MRNCAIIHLLHLELETAYSFGFELLVMPFVSLVKEEDAHLQW